MWIEIHKDDIETFPGEGITVLVTDGTNYDVAWYLMSSEYKWVKTDITNDCLIDFEAFVPTMWRTIDKFRPDSIIKVCPNCNEEHTETDCSGFCSASCLQESEEPKEAFKIVQEHRKKHTMWIPQNDREEHNRYADDFYKSIKPGNIPPLW